MTTDPIGDFCRDLMGNGALRREIAPASVAKAFVGFFGLSSLPRMEEITGALDRAGVGTSVAVHMPDSVRGAHIGGREGRYLIQYDASEWRGAQEHTVLHETYEILRERLHDLYPGIGHPQGRWLCREADRFAAAVLMQPELFAPFAENSGFDVVALQRMYRRAYASVTIRLAEVMGHQPLLAVLYERRGREQPFSLTAHPSPAQFRATVVARTPGFALRTQRRPASNLRGLLPRRGSPPTPGSVAERVVFSGRPVYVERVSGYDLWKTRDVTVAARPVRWKGQLVKVAVVAVPHYDRSVLLPQLANAGFDRLAEVHQVI